MAHHTLGGRRSADVAEADEDDPHYVPAPSSSPVQYR
jgi:hypothetical protein